MSLLRKKPPLASLCAVCLSFADITNVQMHVIANFRALSHAAASTSTGSSNCPPRRLGSPRRVPPAVATKTDLQAISGVGRANAALLRRQGIGSVEHLQQLLLADCGGDPEQLSRFLQVGVQCVRVGEWVCGVLRVCVCVWGGGTKPDRCGAGG